MRVGAILPESGVRSDEVPPEYEVRHDRYTVVNERPVLVEPVTRRIVEIVESGSTDHGCAGAPPARRRSAGQDRAGSTLFA